MRYLVTGGCGFIGSALIRKIGNSSRNHILNIDKLTYAGNLASIPENLKGNYKFIKLDLANYNELSKVVYNYKPDIIINFAAESHVDRSIENSKPFISSNILGVYNLLEAARRLFSTYTHARKRNFRLIQISTDEVYGDIPKHKMSKETDQHLPNSPYAASKSASDQLVRAWSQTYSLPTITTHCCNNFGPYQMPEKLIPLIILNALEHKKLPIYGNGKQIRDWIHVDENIDILLKIIIKADINEHYNISSENSFRNIDLVKLICQILDRIYPSCKLSSYKKLITKVTDRPSHDKRYSLNSGKLYKLIGKRKKYDFSKQLESTIMWYANNEEWLKKIKNKSEIRKRQGLV